MPARVAERGGAGQRDEDTEAGPEGRGRGLKRQSRAISKRPIANERKLAKKMAPGTGTSRASPRIPLPRGCERAASGVDSPAETEN